MDIAKVCRTRADGTVLKGSELIERTGSDYVEKYQNMTRFVFKDVSLRSIPQVFSQISPPDLPTTPLLSNQPPEIRHDVLPTPVIIERLIAIYAPISFE